VKQSNLHSAGVFGRAPTFRYSYDEPIFYDGDALSGYGRYSMRRNRVVIDDVNKKTDVIRKKISEHRSDLYLRLIKYFDECGCGSSTGD
jgi:hypothetical protein